ncbi:PH domain-containing protein [Actinomycetospora termitidis]|uniref:PH domain-containing protein n=1 Tax=Actinomycetospora termitidis TaxID=3053470 RepID=A0ABT7MBQ9_9PSEU|nr:PH domain-containing protein [Actinomycetospora sp. Odt1-22]MDL5158092.1 PH domain-containing protein [Actinomycetospora sp. Odt1-22]
MTAPADGWRQLDRRTVVASAALALGACVAAGVPTLMGMRSADRFSFTVAVGLAVGGTVLVVGLAVVLEYVRLARTRFRVGTDRVEVRSGILVRTCRGLARERVRTVEVTADPVLRLLGLASVRIGTGQRTSATDKPLELRALRRPDAEALRGLLLDREGRIDPPHPREGTPHEAGAGGSSPHDDGAPRDATLAVLDPTWVRFAPVSLLTPTLGIAAFGVLLQGADWIGLQQTVLTDAADVAIALGLVVSLVVGLVVVVVVGTVASVAVFVESWWGYRLTRERRTGSLHVRRGLLTTRSTTVEEDRLRGVAVVEPPGIAWFRAARVDAVATGLSAADEQRSDPRGLLPVAPRAVVERVVAEVLREPVAPTREVTLRAHPVAARRRRVRWALMICLVPAVALAVVAVLVGSTAFAVLTAVAAVLGLAAGVRLGRLAYRNLGHGLVGDYVVTRHGAPGRRTVALRRGGILTWTLTQTPFQRRAGLVTLWFTTAAGDGRYGVFDVGVDEAMAFAVETLGERFSPYLAAASMTP